MSVRDHLQSPPPASRIRASPWIAREDGNIPVAQATLAMKLCPPGGNGQRYPPALRAARLRVPGWEPGRHQINIAFGNVRGGDVVPQGQRRRCPARGPRAQPAGWIDLTEMNWIGRSISAFGPCGTSPTNWIASPGSSR